MISKKALRVISSSERLSDPYLTIAKYVFLLRQCLLRPLVELGLVLLGLVELGLVLLGLV